LEVSIGWFILRVNNKRYEGEIYYRMGIYFNEILIKVDGKGLEKNGECKIARLEKDKIILECKEKF
jgi:hypothetical protein